MTDQRAADALADYRARAAAAEYEQSQTPLGQVLARLDRITVILERLSPDPEQVTQDLRASKLPR